MKVVLISGGSSGIGKGCVEQLLEEGYKVATFARSTIDISSNDNLLVMKGDVRDEESLKKAVAETLKKFDQIDILINNAGYGYFSEADKVDIEKYKDMMETNVIGLANLTKLVVPHMKKRKEGLIINIASIAGKVGYPLGEFYNSTKFAVMGYSEGLRKELQDFNIKVSTVCPGMTDTNFFPPGEIERRKKMGSLKNMMDVKDITRVISLICSQSKNSNVQDVTIMHF